MTPRSIRKSIKRGDITEARGLFLISTIDAVTPEAFGVLTEGLVSPAWFLQGDFDAFGINSQPLRSFNEPDALMEELGWKNTSTLNGTQGWTTLTTAGGEELVVVLGAEGTHRNPHLAAKAAELAKSHGTSGLAAAVVCGTIWRVIDPDSEGLPSVFIDAARAKPQFVRMVLSPQGIINAAQRQKVEIRDPSIREDSRTPARTGVPRDSARVG